MTHFLPFIKIFIELYNTVILDKANLILWFLKILCCFLYRCTYWKLERGREGRRDQEGLSTDWFTPPSGCKAGWPAGCGAQALKPSLGAAGTWASAHLGCWHCRPWLNPIYYDTIPFSNVNQMLCYYYWVAKFIFVTGENQTFPTQAETNISSKYTC